MDFKTDKPIYRQIVDYCFACILTRKWLPGEKVPSVREMALQMAVNTHTVIKAFDFLQDAGVIYPKRGMGFFLADDAESQVDRIRREQFFSATLDHLFSEMDMLGISMDSVVEHWKARKNRAADAPEPTQQQ